MSRLPVFVHYYAQTGLAKLRRGGHRAHDQEPQRKNLAARLTVRSDTRTMRSSSGQLTGSGWIASGDGRGAGGDDVTRVNDGSGIGTALPEAAEAGPAVAGGPEGMAEDDWAVCCLGLYPFCRLLPRGPAEPAEAWAAREGQMDPGVSGGSYIASSRALVA